METQWQAEFVQNALYRMDESSRMIKIALAKISENELWQRPNEQSNSIGNLLLHLCGNVTQYAIASLGNSPDNRERDLEFSTEQGWDKQQLLEELDATVAQAKEVVQSTSQAEWLRVRDVQGFRFSGIGVIMHVVEHYSYHTGQIAFWVKQLKNKDLGFYDGMNLNTLNND